MTLTELRDLCHKNSFEAGWWDEIDVEDPRHLASMIALMHSELSEALDDGVRKDKMDKHLPQHKAVTAEMADTIIRILDFCGGLDLPIEEAVIEKLEYNKTRADHKKEARESKEGKRI